MKEMIFLNVVVSITYYSIRNFDRRLKRKKKIQVFLGSTCTRQVVNPNE